MSFSKTSAFAALAIAGLSANLASAAQTDAQIKHRLVKLGYCAMDYGSDTGKGIFIFGQNGVLMWKLATPGGVDITPASSSYDGEYDSEYDSAYGGEEDSAYSADSTEAAPAQGIVKGTWSVKKGKIQYKLSHGQRTMTVNFDKNTCVRN